TLRWLPAARTRAVPGLPKQEAPNVHGRRRPGERVTAAGAGGDALLAGRALGPRQRPYALDEGRHRRFLRRAGGERAGERVLGGDAHEGDAEERVGPRREDRDLAGPPFEGGADLRPLGSPAPGPPP